MDEPSVDTAPRRKRGADQDGPEPTPPEEGRERSTIQSIQRYSPHRWIPSRGPQRIFSMGLWLSQSALASEKTLPGIEANKLSLGVSMQGNSWSSQAAGEQFPIPYSERAVCAWQNIFSCVVPMVPRLSHSSRRCKGHQAPAPAILAGRRSRTALVASLPPNRGATACPRRRPPLG